MSTLQGQRAYGLPPPSPWLSADPLHVALGERPKIKASQPTACFFSHACGPKGDGRSSTYGRISAPSSHSRKRCQGEREIVDDRLMNDSTSNTPDARSFRLWYLTHGKAARVPHTRAKSVSSEIGSRCTGCYQPLPHHSLDERHPSGARYQNRNPRIWRNCNVTRLD